MKKAARLFNQSEDLTPSPLVGEGRGGGDFVPLQVVAGATRSATVIPSHPVPPPQGGRGRFFCRPEIIFIRRGWTAIVGTTVWGVRTQ